MQMQITIQIKSVKKAVNCGPKLNPKAIIKKAYTAAICPFTLELLTPLTAKSPNGAKELMKKR